MKMMNPLRISRIVMVITLLTFSALAFFSYMRLNNLIEYNRLVEETNEVKLETQKCLSYLKDAETGARGFLMTKDSSYLKPLVEANTELYVSLGQLTMLSDRSSESVPFIRSFRSAAIRKISFLNRLVYNYRFVPVFEISRESLVQDKLLMEYARKQATAVEKNLDRKLAKRNQTRRTYLIATPFFIIILSFSSILLILIAYTIIMRELRKRILVQQELEMNITALRSSNMELEQFAYIASHDLQEPLRKIRTFANRLHEKYAGKIDADAEQILGRMQSSAEHMQILINDLLTYSSLVDHEAINPEDVDLNKILKDVINDVQETVEEKKAVIQAAVLPVVQGKSSQLEQLLHNLICNSLKFSHADRPPVIIIDYDQVHGRQVPANDFPAEKRYHRLTIKDNGIGFNESFSDKLFVIFQRLHDRKKYPGTGIGLAICKKVVTNHHGYIQATSKPQEGTTFTIFLPQEIA